MQASAEAYTGSPLTISRGLEPPVIKVVVQECLQPADHTFSRQDAKQALVHHACHAKTVKIDCVSA